MVSFDKTISDSTRSSIICPCTCDLYMLCFYMVQYKHITYIIMYIPNVSYHEVRVAGWACFYYILFPAASPPNGDSGWRLSDLCDGVRKHHRCWRKIQLSNQKSLVIFGDPRHRISPKMIKNCKWFVSLCSQIYWPLYISILHCWLLYVSHIYSGMYVWDSFQEMKCLKCMEMLQ